MFNCNQMCKLFVYDSKLTSCVFAFSSGNSSARALFNSVVVYSSSPLPVSVTPMLEHCAEIENLLFNNILIALV